MGNDFEEHGSVLCVAVSIECAAATGTLGCPLRYRFVWDGWKMLAELDGTNSNAPLREYSWGKDLSGSLEGAGTIGGLLAVDDTENSVEYVYFHDAMGNVGQVVDITAATYSAAVMTATYEYDPFGNVVTSTVSYAVTNPFKYSTKYFDAETGLGYWGYRYYSPNLGRWINRDPIGGSFLAVSSDVMAAGVVTLIV